MSEIVTLICPTCGGKLKLIGNDERLVCEHCGTEHIVKRSKDNSGDKVSFVIKINTPERRYIGPDKTASELAIRRLNEEIQVLMRRIQDIQMQPVLRQRQDAQRKGVVSGLQRVGCIFFVPIGALLAWIGLVAGLYDSMLAGMGILGVISVLLGGYLGWQSIRRPASLPLTPAETTRIEELHALINEKQRELNHHYQIVDI